MTMSKENGITWKGKYLYQSVTVRGDFEKHILNVKLLSYSFQNTGSCLYCCFPSGVFNSFRGSRQIL